MLLPAPGLTVTGELEIRRSRFITWVRRVSSEQEARDLVAEARAAYPDARHHCSAWIHQVDGANPVTRSSDDGEPSGTAGRPMLDVLTGSGLTDIGAVVVRYFGGVKLGTGGLVRAYSDAVAQVLPEVPRMRRVRRALRAVDVDHADAGRLEADLRARGVEVTGVDYHAAATLTLAIDPGEVDTLEATVQSITRGRLSTRDAGQTWAETPAG